MQNYDANVKQTCKSATLTLDEQQRPDDAS